MPFRDLHRLGKGRSSQPSRLRSPEADTLRWTFVPSQPCLRAAPKLQPACASTSSPTWSARGAPSAWLSLEQALARTRGEVEADIHFQPFELNPQLGAEGEDAVEHLQKKYGMTAAQVAANQEAIRQRGAELGFTFDMERRRRTYNTFDAHRLLHWAGEEGRQRELKHALLRAYFTDGRDVSDHDTLVDIAASVGLPADRARGILGFGHLRRRRAHGRAVLPAARHPRGAGGDHRAQAPDLRRPAGRGVRAGVAADRGGEATRIRRGWASIVIDQSSLTIVHVALMAWRRSRADDVCVGLTVKHQVGYFTGGVAARSSQRLLSRTGRDGIARARFRRRFRLPDLPLCRPEF